MENWIDVNEAIEKLLNTATEGKDGDEKELAFEQEVMKIYHPARQHFNDSGRSAQKVSSDTKVKKLSDQVATLTSTLAERETKLSEISASGGDAKAETLAKQVAELKKEILSVTAEKTESLSMFEAYKVSSAVDVFKTQLQSAGSSRYASDWLELQLIKMKQEGRITTEEIEGGGSRVAVLQPNKTLPYTADNTEALLSVVLGELDKNCPPERRLTGAKGGGGFDLKGGPAGNEFDLIRQQVKAEKADTVQATPQEVSTRLAGMM